MIRGLHGIIDSKSYITIYGCTNPSASNYDPSANTDDGSCIFPPPFNLSLSRMLLNDTLSEPFVPGEPITAWSIPENLNVSQGYLYLELQAADGDISGVVDFGIVSSTSSNPTYSSNPISTNIGSGLTYSVDRGQRYYRAYAQMNDGSYHYSDGPGELIGMEQINLNSYSISYGLFGGVQINFSFEIVNPISSPSSVFVYFVTGPTLGTNEEYDPYWTKSGLTSLAVEDDNTYNYSNDYTDLYGEIRVWIRISAVINGIEYWSPLI